jgi:D-alanine-D-alanine ligase
MLIGLTFDLRSQYLEEGYSEEETAEFDREETVDSIAQAIESVGHTVDRIGHVRDLVHRLARGNRWDLVFNICEGLHGPAREAQVPAVLDAFDIPYTFSDSLMMGVCLDKGLTKLIVQRAGIPTPRFAVVRREADAAGVEIGFPAFVKPIAEGTGKGVAPSSKVHDAAQLSAECRAQLAKWRQPVLVEEYLPGREFTVGLLGTGERAEVLGTLEIVLRPEAEADVYSYVNKEKCEELVEYRPVDRNRDEPVRKAEEIALAAWRTLECRDAGRIDLRCDREGRPQFLEVNPLAGLHPQHSDLPMIATAERMPYVELIRRIIESAADRVQAKSSVQSVETTNR